MSGLAEVEILLLSRARQRLPYLAGGLVLANLLVLASLLTYTVLQSRPLWTLFRREYSLATWFSSVQLLLLALVAYAIYRLLAVSRGVGTAAVRHRWVWGVVACGFLVLALDERFGIHEVLRDALFRPAGIWADSPYFIPGDAGLHLFFLVGLVLTPFLIGELRPARGSLMLYGLALLLSLAVILIDSLRGSTVQGWPAWRFWDYTFEEMGEIWAELLFLLAFLGVLSRRLGELAGIEGAQPPQAGLPEKVHDRAER